MKNERRMMWLKKVLGTGKFQSVEIWFS